MVKQFIIVRRKEKSIQEIERELGISIKKYGKKGRNFYFEIETNKEINIERLLPLLRKDQWEILRITEKEFKTLMSE